MKFRIGEIYEPTAYQGWEAAIDLWEDGASYWHERAICCYGTDRRKAVSLRSFVAEGLEEGGWSNAADEQD